MDFNGKKLLTKAETHYFCKKLKVDFCPKLVFGPMNNFAKIGDWISLKGKSALVSAVSIWDLTCS